jgi:hypothetical protein
MMRCAAGYKIHAVGAGEWNSLDIRDRHPSSASERARATAICFPASSTGRIDSAMRSRQTGVREDEAVHAIRDEEEARQP